MHITVWLYGASPAGSNVSFVASYVVTPSGNQNSVEYVGSPTDDPADIHAAILDAVRTRATVDDPTIDSETPILSLLSFAAL